MSNVTLGHETADRFIHGAKTVGTTRAQLTTRDFKCFKGVMLKTPVANTGVVYIGGGSVTNNNADETGGIPLAPGDAIGLPVESPSLLYVVADDADQVISYAGF